MSATTGRNSPAWPSRRKTRSRQRGSISLPTTVTLPKAMTSNAKADGRFGKQDFRYVADEDVFICPAGERLAYRYTNEENGWILRRYWTNACQSCAIKHSCTPSKERRIPRWEHEPVLEA